KLLVREPAQRCPLAPARSGSLLGHVGGLVPGQDRGGAVQVVDLEQAALELRKSVLGRPPVVASRWAGLPRARRYGPAGAGFASSCSLGFGLAGFGLAGFGLAGFWLASLGHTSPGGLTFVVRGEMPHHGTRRK